MNILISGISGSLGTALSNYYLLNPPDKLVGYSRDWQKQDFLRDSLGDPEHMRWFHGDILDQLRLKQAMRNIDLVIHCAAVKSVPACEYNARSAVHINVLGTENVINAAIDAGVEKVIVISSDKAVDALNCYGKTKALAESLSVASNVGHQHIKTKVSVARYGNVFGSSGSVVPLFIEQAKQGTLTITDKKMSRFWLTMEQAVAFILKCIERMNGGEIFLPKIPSAKVTTIAEAIGPGCHLAEIGKRPGEKLYEVLLTEAEAAHTKEFNNHFIIEPEFDFWETDEIGGTDLPDGFSYSSDNNKVWLSVEDIRGML